jgi:hypothetical protein
MLAVVGIDLLRTSRLAADRQAPRESRYLVWVTSSVSGVRAFNVVAV